MLRIEGILFLRDFRRMIAMNSHFRMFIREQCLPISDVNPEIHQLIRWRVSLARMHEPAITTIKKEGQTLGRNRPRICLIVISGNRIQHRGNVELFFWKEGYEAWRQKQESALKEL